MSLSNKALLVTLNVSQWTGRKLDRKATSSVESSHSTQGNVGNYHKRLLPGATELRKVSASASALREFFYTQTLPWLADGTRILSSANYIDFTSAFRSYRSDYENSVKAFIDAYPALRIAAQSKLGELFNDGEYPTEQSLAERFACSISFMPLPDVSDFRIELSDAERADFESKMRETESRALQDCWQRIYDVVNRATSKLSESKPIFHDSLLENMRDLCALLPKLNVTDSPDLERMRSELESTVSKIGTADALRASSATRSSALTQLKDIESRMGAFMGAVQS